MLTTLEGHVQHRVDHDQRHDAQRHVDVEDPAPRQVLGEEAAQQRPGDAGQAPHTGEVARVATTFARRDDVADDRERQRHQAAGAEPLHGPGGNELPHRLRQTGEHRADDEHHDREDVDGATSVEVGDLAVQRGRRRRGEQVGRHDPGELVEPAEVADDGRQRGRDDGLVESREQHAEHQAAEHHQDLAVRHVGRAGGCRRCGRGSHADVSVLGRFGAGSADSESAKRVSVATSVGAVLGRPVVQRVGEPPVAPGPRLVEHGESGGRDLEADCAPVVEVFGAGDKPAVLQRLGLPADRRDVQQQVARQVGEPHRAVLLQAAQDDDRRTVDGVVVHRALGLRG